MKERTGKSISFIAKLLLVVYLLLLLYLTFFSSRFSRGIGLRGINLVPFTTISQYLSGYMTTKSIIINLAGNIVAFMPFGFLLPLAYKVFRKFAKTVLLAFLLTILIEIGQYITSSGISDIDDIILNVLGGILGYILFCGAFQFYEAFQRYNFRKA